PSIEGATSPANVLLLIHLWLLVARRIGISVRDFAVGVRNLTPRPPRWDRQWGGHYHRRRMLEE
ncbi:MAG TPA: hypothetical protein VGF01_12475, partial [Terracidiphilus sp.]